MSNFSFFPQCFQKACLPGASKGVIVCEWVKQVENTVGKGEMLFTRNFAFTDILVKRCELQTHKNLGLFENGTLKSLKSAI